MKIFYKISTPMALCHGGIFINFLLLGMAGYHLHKERSVCLLVICLMAILHMADNDNNRLENPEFTEDVQKL